MRSPKLRTILSLALALVLGYAARAIEAPASRVLAQSHSSQSHPPTDDALAFELSGIGPTTALTVYSTSERTLYVYPAVTQGSSHVNCSFMLHMSRTGGAIDRVNCPAGSAQ